MKIRLVPQNRYFDPVELVQSGKVEKLMEAMYWNYKKRSFRAAKLPLGSCGYKGITNGFSSMLGK